MSDSTKQNMKAKRWIKSIPIIFVLAIIPLIVFEKEYNPRLSEFRWFTSQTSAMDFFLYYKAWIFVIVCAITAVVWLISIVIKILDNPNISFKQANKIKFTVAIIPVFIYGLFALLSTMASPYSYFGFKGIFEQQESMFVLLGYCFILVYGFYYVSDARSVKIMINILSVGVGIMCLIGFTQAFKFDFFQSYIGRRLILPFKYWEMADNITFNFGTTAYLTLYNPNYVGLYSALMAPIFIILTFFENKNKILKTFYYIISIILLICIISAGARNGFVAFLAAFFFLVIFLRKKIKQNLKRTLLGFLVSIIILGGYALYNGDNFLIRLGNTLNDENIFTGERILTSILTTDDSVEFTYNGNKLYIQADWENLDFLVSVVDATEVTDSTTLEDSKELSIKLSDDSTKILIDDSRFNDFAIQIVSFEKFYGFIVTINGMDNVQWIFSNQVYENDSSYYYYNTYGKWDKIINAESAIFTNYETLGSYRGYIWSRTIPLLKDYLVLGSGADTFSIVFPQNDYLGRYYNTFLSSIISKPHNLYLQIGVQTGVISLIAFLALYLIYFVSSIKLYFKNKFENYVSYVGLALFLGSIGYMVSSIFNDSTVTVAPIYWALIGLGLGINYLLNHSDGIELDIVDDIKENNEDEFVLNEIEEDKKESSEGQNIWEEYLEQYKDKEDE